MKASFIYTKTGLSVEFTNQSTGNPVSLVWEFGDGVSSVDNNPEHLYPYPGFFTVTLTATFDELDEEDNPITDTRVLTIGLVDDETLNPLDTPLLSLIGTFLPVNIDIESPHLHIPSLISKWQLFLQPLVNPEIPLVKVYQELYWPPLVNYLIAQLVAYDLIVVAANQYLIGVGQVSSTDSTESPGEVKSIKTGPSEVEWFQGSETWGEIFKPGGTFDQLTNQICSLSHRLRITLYICEPLSHSPKVPQVYKKPKPRITNPFLKNKL